MMDIIKNTIKKIFCIFIYIMLSGCDVETTLGPGTTYWTEPLVWQSGSYYEELAQYEENIEEAEENYVPLCGEDISLNMDAPSLNMDTNGFYHMNLETGYNQTFSTLRIQTGLSDYTVPVGWGSDTYYLYSWGNNNVDTVAVVNPTSYTDSNGEAQTVFSAWNSFLGDTITVYSGFRDNCYIEHYDSLKIIIED